jgi:hypothetical protein
MLRRLSNASREATGEPSDLSVPFSEFPQHILFDITSRSIPASSICATAPLRQ